MATFSKRSLDSLVGVHPELVRLMHSAIVNAPVDFTIVEGVRTVQRQQQLYAIGRTVPGHTVTNADGVRNKSNHQPKADGYGHAVDLYPYINGQVQVNDIRGLKVISDYIKTVAQNIGINIEWGGDWNMRDYPHFELKS